MLSAAVAGTRTGRPIQRSPPFISGSVVAEVRFRMALVLAASGLESHPLR